MTKVMMVKSYGGLKPEGDEAYQLMKRLGDGTVVIADIKDTTRRSGRQHRFWFAILNVVWENNETLQKHFTTFENYRKKVLIALGRCDSFASKDGTVDRIAHSITFGKMTAEEFTHLVDDTLTFFETEMNIPRAELDRETKQRVGGHE